MRDSYDKTTGTPVRDSAEEVRTSGDNYQATGGYTTTTNIRRGTPERAGTYTTTTTSYGGNAYGTTTSYGGNTYGTTTNIRTGTPDRMRAV